MSNAEAATTLTGVVTGMRSRYGSRLHALFLYQAQDQKPENATNDRENYFGLLQSNGATKGAFTAAVQAVLSSGSLTPAARPAAHVAAAHVASYRAERKHRARAARLARAARRRS